MKFIAIELVFWKNVVLDSTSLSLNRTNESLWWWWRDIQEWMVWKAKGKMAIFYVVLWLVQNIILLKTIVKCHSHNLYISLVSSFILFLVNMGRTPLSLLILIVVWQALSHIKSLLYRWIMVSKIQRMFLNWWNTLF